MKRAFRSLASDFLLFALVSLINVRSSLAYGETVSPNVMRMDIEGWVVANFREMVIVPLLAIGIVSYVLVFLYKSKKWNIADLNHIRRIGKISSMVSLAAIAVNVFINMKRSGDSFYYVMASWTIPMLGFYVVSWIIILIAGIYSLEYVWKLAKKDLPARKK